LNGKKTGFVAHVGNHVPQVLRRKQLQDGATMATQPTDTGKPRLRAQGDELTVIAQRAQAFTNASGTAIALSEGNADEIVCRARSGSAAPEVGAALRVDGSFTGLCIQTGKELRCDDTETDTRVDTAAIRTLGIRSMVVTPIREDNRVIGVLACFASTAHAFTITHVAVLKTMSDQISVLLQKEKRNREEGITPDVQPAQPKPVASAAVAFSPPVVIKSAAAAPAPAKGPVPVIKAEPVRTAATVSFPRTEEKEKPEVRAGFGTFDSMTEEKSGSNSKMLGIVALLVVVLAGGGYYLLKGNKTASSATRAALPAASQPVAAGNEVPNAAQAATSPAAPASNGVSSRTSESARAMTDTVRASDKKSAEKPNPSAKNADRTIAEDQVPQKPAATTVTLGGGQSHIAVSNAPQAEVSANLGLAGNNMSGALSAMARPITTAAPTIAQSELVPMKVLKSVPPIYPPIAKVRRLSGPVVVEVKIGKDGHVSNPKFVSGQPVFRDAAFDAVKQWLFKPAMLNGQPIEQTTQIKVVFNSPQ
jgi:TonB family protein